MSQPGSPVDVVNLALDLLQQQPVASINPPSVPAADVMARWYDTTRRLLLRKYIFNFARKTVLLTVNANAPTHPEFVNGYSLPVDLVRILKLGDRVLWGGAIPTQFFDFSNGFLYCDDLTDQGVGLANPAPAITISGIFRSGDLYQGVVVPAGQTVVTLVGTPLVGAQYQISGVVGSVQANGNTYQFVAGKLSSLSVYFLQTAAGQNFDSSTWGVYVSGGTATATFIPPGVVSQPTGLEFQYIYDAVTVAQFDPAFIDLFACHLAVRGCRKITGRKPGDDLISELRNAELAAAAIAGQEKPPLRVQRSRIRDVRRSGGIFRNNTVIGGWGP